MTFIKKIHVAVALLLISSIGNAYEPNCNLFQCEIDDCSPCQPSCWGKGFISADLLYWRAFESGLDRCVPVRTCDTITCDDRVVSRFKGKGRNPHFRWDPGFRIGFGYAPACSDWGVAAFWTHFHSHANRSENCRSEHRWKLDLDTVDVVLGYDFDLNCCVHLRPFGGVRWANIDQHLNFGQGFESRSDCSSSSSNPRGSNDLNFSKTHLKQDFSGVGPLLGLEADWKIGCGFSFYISGAVSWLYGKFHINKQNSNVSADTASYWSERTRLDANVAATDAGLGVRWQTCIFGNKQLFLQLGLEHHRYYDFNRIGNYGDLSFDGANFSAAIEF
ncbi:MAG: hypothetical protein H0U49_03015 [Parachlamydiaceae bacterium]|nr:hypothetical protein [Parachlamydiaceae bacterium]